MVTLDEFLETVRDMELYTHVGEPTGCDDVIEVHSWDEAIARVRSLDWINFCTDRQNDFWDFSDLSRKFREDQHANADYLSFIETMRPQLHALAAQKVQRLNVKLSRG